MFLHTYYTKDHRTGYRVKQSGVITIIESLLGILARASAREALHGFLVLYIAMV